MGYRGDLGGLGRYVSTRMMEVAHYVDRVARPRLRRWSVRGEDVAWVEVAPEHREVLRELQGFGVTTRVVGGDLLGHFLSGYVVSDAGFFCSLTLTAQVAYGLAKYGDGALREQYLPHFARGEWLGATFYTEAAAGSDQGNIETVAEPAGGNLWRLRGTKYFASNAGLADAAVVTARPAPPRPGAKGVAAFFVPARGADGAPNWRILRLKDKLGTVTVPTGEVEVSGVGHYLGDIRVALELLTVARIDNSTAALGLARKALWEAYLYGLGRRAFGRRLVEHPLYLRDLLEMEARLEANLALTLQAAKAFAEAADERPPYGARYLRARLLSHIAKNMAAWASIDITRQAMEMLGGIGFLEEFPLAKLHRDALVTPIWEGTSNIHALDMLEAMGKGADIFGELKHVIEGLGDGRGELEALWGIVRAEFSDAAADCAEAHAKRLLARLGALAAAVYHRAWAQDAASRLGEKWPLAISRIYLLGVVGKDLSSDLLKEAEGALLWMG